MDDSIIVVSLLESLMVGWELLQLKELVLWLRDEPGDPPEESPPPPLGHQSLPQ